MKLEFRFISVVTFCFIVVFSAKLSAREFLNTFMQVNIGYSNSIGVGGDLVDAERSNNLAGKRLKYDDSSINFMMDLVPFRPIILGDESAAIKIGFRGGYRMHYLEQRFTANDGNGKQEYKGDLMKYNTVVFGPVIRYAPQISLFGSLDDSYSAESGLTLFALYGHVLNGNIDAFAANRAYGESFPGITHSSMSGYKIDIGIGGETSICSVNLGLNLYYSYMRMKFGDAIYENVGRKSSLHSFCLEIYFGMPLENRLPF